MRRLHLSLAIGIIAALTTFDASLAYSGDLCIIKANKPVFTTLDAARFAERIIRLPRSEWEPIAREMGRTGVLLVNDKPMRAIILTRPTTGIGWLRVKIIEPIIRTAYVWTEHCDFPTQ